MQPRGPSEKGCAAFFLSLSYAASVHRSGMYSSGSLKFSGLCAAAQLLTQTEVYFRTSQPNGFRLWALRE